MCDFRGWSILVDFKKVYKKKKSLPTDPNFEDHAIGNTHIFLFGLSCIAKKNPYSTQITEFNVNIPTVHRSTEQSIY